MNFRNHSVGNVIEHKIGGNSIEGKTDAHRFKLTAYNSQIIRVQVSKYNEFEEYPYAVILAPEAQSASIIESEHQFSLISNDLKCYVQKNPFRLRFENRNGELLNEDDNTFGISWLAEEVTCYKQLADDEIFLGLGEKTGGLNRRGSSYTNWNTDAFGFNNDTDPLYVSTPFYIGVREGKPYGIFFDNTHKSHFNFGASNNDRFAYFSAEAGDMNYYFIQGDTVGDIIQQYTVITLNLK
jgi:alpha-glucosidase